MRVVPQYRGAGLLVVRVTDVAAETAGRSNDDKQMT